MKIYMSDLATNEQNKALLMQRGLTEEVGYIELGMCPECHKSNNKPIKNKKFLALFHQNGMCVPCQKKISIEIAKRAAAKS